MENCEVVKDMPSYSMAIPSEIPDCHRSTMIEENKICPICRSEVRLYFINFNEKFLMCENEECEYPFGFGELEFVKEVEEVASDEEVASIKSKFSQLSPSATCSLTSTNAWNDIHKLNKACGSEVCQFETNSSNSVSGKPVTQKYKKYRCIDKNEMKNQEEIKKKLAEIKELNVELKDEITNVKMKNEKWIKNLKTFQEMSGFPLLKPEEISLLKADQPIIGNGELKIDIDTSGANNMSSIKIQITNQGTTGDANNTESAKPNESVNKEDLEIKNTN